MPQSNPLVLVADDHADSVDLLEQRLEQAGYRTAAAYDGEEALRQVEECQPDLLLLDLVMPKRNGIQVIRELRRQRRYRDLPIIVLTGKTEVQDRIAGLDAGADEYLSKPTEDAELLARVRAMLRMREALLERRRLEAENERLRSEVALREGSGEMVGRSPAMQQVYSLVEKVAAAPASVLITGESGTGKELVAHAIHRQGARARGPFVVVNCGALPENLLEAELFGHKQGSFTGADADRKGLFEAASGGTLFLDEIGDISEAMQVRLLRVLQEGEVKRLGENEVRRVDLRLVAATNKDLKEEVEVGRFRRDLYFRLNVISIHLPPLRQRREDILLLASHFLEKHCQVLGRQMPDFTSEARRCLLDYEWPGNVRELEHEMERMVVLSEENAAIDPEMLSEEVRGTDGRALRAALAGGSLREQMGRIEQHLLLQALQENDWNQTRTAKKLGLTRQGLIKKMHRYGLNGRLQS